MRWHVVPEDVREILCWSPILDAYLALARQQPEWRSQHEYEIYERAWQGGLPGLARAGLQRAVLDLLTLPEGEQAALSADDRGAEHGLEPSADFWDAASLERHGVDKPARARLAAAGWLVAESQQRWQVPHPRLSNWLIAVALVERWEADGDEAALIARVTTLGNAARQTRTPRFAYVGLDVLWLTLGQHAHDVGAQVIRALEGDDAGGSRDRLYARWLPTVGARIVPALWARLALVTGDADAYILPGLAARAVDAVARLEPQAAAEAARALDDGAPPVQDWAVNVLRSHPRGDERILARLWRLTSSLRRAFERDRQTARHWRSDSLFYALRGCCRLRPEWLAEQIRGCGDVAALSEMLRFASELDTDAAAGVWRQIKPDVIEELSRHAPDAVIIVVSAAGDGDEAARLEGWCDDPALDQSQQGAAEALARVARTRALARLARASVGQLVRWRKRWLVELADDHRPAVEAALETALANAGALFWEVGSVALEAHLASPMAFDRLLDRLAVELATATAGVEQPNDPWGRRLRLAANAARSDVALRKRCQARAGRELDQTLARRAAARLEEIHRDEFEAIRDILQCVAGPGLGHVVEAMLGNADHRVVLEGLHLARRCAPTAALTSAVVGHALVPLTDDHAADWSGEAAQTLAALGADTELVAAALHLGLRQPHSLGAWRPVAGPMSDEVIRPLLDALRSLDVDRRTAALCALNVTGRSDLAGEIHGALEGVALPTSATLAALVSLRDLGARDAPTLALAERCVAAGVHVPQAESLLADIGTPRALAALAATLGSDESFVPPHAEWKLHVIEQAGGELAVTVARRFWAHVQREARGVQHWGHLWATEVGLLEPLRDDADVRAFLEEWAFRPDPDTSWLRGSRYEAVRTLGRVDPALGFEAAQHALATAGHEREIFAELLVEIDPGPKSAAALVEQLRNERESRVRWMIGVALRRVRDRADVRDRLRRLLVSPTPRLRYVAAEALCAQEPGMLADEIQVARSDPNPDVRTMARRVAQAWRVQEQMADLVGALAHATPAQRWSLLDALVEAAPTVWWAARGDVLGIGAAVRAADPAQRASIRQRIKDAPKKLADDGKRTDRHLHDRFEWASTAESVFICYSHSEAEWMERLLAQVQPLVKAGRIDPWSDEQIDPGREWQADIRAAIARATSAVLLVSPHFATSPFIQQTELPLLLERHAAGDLALVPVPVSPWEPPSGEVPPAWWQRLAEVQWQPRRDRPLARLDDEPAADALRRIGELLSSG